MMAGNTYSYRVFSVCQGGCVGSRGGHQRRHGHRSDGSIGLLVLCVILKLCRQVTGKLTVLVKTHLLEFLSRLSLVVTGTGT